MTDLNVDKLTPPPDLVHQWLGEFFGGTIKGELSDSEKFLATQAARWGADMELEACCEWVENWLPNFSGGAAEELLRAARRPKPPSLKEQALQAWAAVEAGTDDQTAMVVIRRALEALPND